MCQVNNLSVLEKLLQLPEMLHSYVCFKTKRTNIANQPNVQRRICDLKLDIF